MLGFSDIADDDLLTIEDVAKRCGYDHASSLYRFLKRKGAPRPPRFFRARYRGADVKAWFAALTHYTQVADQVGAAPDDETTDETACGTVVEIDAAHRRMLARLRACT